MISTVIVSLNQAKDLRNCLETIAGDSDEIVVVDLQSSDESIKVAEKYGAKVYSHPFVEYVEKVRDFAVSKANSDWVLVLDPDENMTPLLWEKLKDIAKKDEFLAVNIPRKNIFFGRWISHTNWWPDKHVRFFKKGKVSWKDKIHLYPKVDGKILELLGKEDLAILHYGYKSIQDFINRQSRYSTIKAMNLYEEGIKFSLISFFWNPVREFLVRFVKHLGFLDGFYGFALSFLMAVYQMEVMIKLWELERKK